MALGSTFTTKVKLPLEAPALMTLLVVQVSALPVVAVAEASVPGPPKVIVGAEV